MLDQIPASSLLHRDMPAGAYRDCHLVDLPCGDASMERILAAFFGATPAWIRGLLALRNSLVGPLGLKTGPGSPQAPMAPFRVGQRIGLFRLHALTEAEAVLGEDDRHLDFRTSLLVMPDRGSGRKLAICTWVHPHNAWGRIYFALVKRFHRRIVPVMARATCRRLERVA